MDNTQAKQIASLLNQRNQLVIEYNTEKILSQKENFVFIEENKIIVACAEIKKVQWYQWEISHVSVNSDGQGLGKRIVRMAEEKALTSGAKIIQCTIRLGNERSVRLFESLAYNRCSKFYYAHSGNFVEVYQKALVTERS